MDKRNEQMTLQARGEGRTTQQMKAAPKGAIYVWCNNHLHYPRQLSLALGRLDLTIVGPEWLKRKGYTNTEVVVDHAAELTFEQQRGLTGYRYVAR